MFYDTRMWKHFTDTNLSINNIERNASIYG